MIYHRRSVLGMGVAAGLLALPGCSSLPGLSLTEAVKRLLTLSSQNAFAELLQPNGFFDSQIADAVTIINGGPRAATSLLQGQLGNTLVDRMLPGIGNGLRLFDNEIINLVLSQATNVDFSSISRDVTNKVSDAIYRSIGAQEASIRANPRATNDPLLIAVLGAGKAF